MDRYEEQRKYRNLNMDYLSAVENVKRNREDAHKIVKERKALDSTLWDANARLSAACEIENLRQREMAVQEAQEELDRAATAIRKKNEQYEAMKRELEEFKKGIAVLLNRLKNDRHASHLIDTALLTRLNRELIIKQQGLTNAKDFYSKLGMVLDTLSGVGSISEEDLEIRKEYDVTMKTITSLSDMIEYYEEREALLLKETVADGQEADGAERPKTELEKTVDLARAQEILEEELRPKRIERSKNRDKLLLIVSTQARKVDLDPRDLDGILTVEQMREKREGLASEIRAMESEIEAFTRLVRQFERKTLLFGGGVSALFASLKKRKSAGRAPKEDGAADPDETEEEQFIFRYKIAQRELSRRYNQIMGIKDTVTEHAYVGEDDDY